MSGADLRQQRALERENAFKEKQWGLVLPSAYPSEEALYGEICECLKTYWDTPDPRYIHLVASAVLVSYRVKEFHTLGHLFFYGQKDTNKTQVARMMKRLCFNGLLFSNVSGPGLYQTINRWHPTILFDEADRLNSEQSEYTTMMLQLLNVYNDDEVVIRASREDGIPLPYDLFSLKMLFATEPFLGNLPDRCIQINMAHNIRQDIPMTFNEQVFKELRAELEYYYNRHELADIDLDQLRDRIGDNRTTQLYHPYYACCPTAEGKQAILELAQEQAKERSATEESSDLATVCEGVWKALGQPDLNRLSQEPSRVLQVELANIIDCTDTSDMGKGGRGNPQDPARWIGWRLSKLHFPRQKVKVEGKSVRIVKIPSKQLILQTRRYLKWAYPVTTGKTGKTEPSLRSGSIRSVGSVVTETPIDKRLEAGPDVVKGLLPLPLEEETPAAKPQGIIEELTAEDFAKLREKILNCLRDESSRPYLTTGQVAYTVEAPEVHVERVLKSLEKEALVFQPHEGCWRLVN